MRTRRTINCWPCARAKAHGELSIVCRVPTVRTRRIVHCFTVCQMPGTRRTRLQLAPTQMFTMHLDMWHTAKLKSSPCAYLRVHGEHLRHAVSPPWRCFALFFAVHPGIHTAKMFVVCPTDGTRQTRSLPCQALPSVIRRRPPTVKQPPCALSTRRSAEIR